MSTFPNIPDGYYSRPIKPPKTLREGLSNFVQMIVNDLGRGEFGEALLRAVDLLGDVDSGIYDRALPSLPPNWQGVPLVDPERAAADLSRRLEQARAEGFRQGVQHERNRIVRSLVSAA